MGLGMRARRALSLAATLRAAVRAAGGPVAAAAMARRARAEGGFGGLKAALVAAAAADGTSARREKILRGLDVAKLRGVEIGALANPVVSKQAGEIFYVDYADEVFLKEHYKRDPAVNCDDIVAVDGVWGENTLLEAIGGGAVDYVVASHVVEHVPDLIAWLEEVRAVLVRGGTLRLAVPDRRFTFDYLRRESVLADLIDANLRHARVPLPRMILDCDLSWREVDARAAWSGKLDEEALAASSRATPAGLEAILARAREALDGRAYHDTHCWVFTPQSLAQLFEEAAALGLIHFACETLLPTEKSQLEFFVTLKPCDDRAECAASWGTARRLAKG